MVAGRATGVEVSDDLIWITFEVREYHGQRCGFDTLVHSSRDEARAYAKANGRVVASTRDEAVRKPVRRNLTVEGM